MILFTTFKLYLQFFLAEGTTLTEVYNCNLHKIPTSFSEERL